MASVRRAANTTNPSAVTTNQTAFFRERHHFEDLAQTLARRPGEAGERPRRRIWSAACSTGEEAYSIAITALLAGIAGPGSDLRILATDLDTEALARARAAAYPAERADACPREYRLGYFETLPGGQVQNPQRLADLQRVNGCLRQRGRARERVG